MTAKLRIASAEDLTKVAVKECGELLVILQEKVPDIETRYIKEDIVPFLGQTIYVRRSVASRLTQAQIDLKKANKNYKLVVTCGYRLPQIQEQTFLKKRRELQATFGDHADLNEITHKFVAVPEVAGHPTGGAIDLTIIDTSTDKLLDMGSGISDFSRPELMPTFSPHLSQEARSNRKLLHDLLTSQQFAPFYGEWWHFSYGDREWAFFYQQPTALYDQIDVLVDKKNGAVPIEGQHQIMSDPQA